ncbi:MAG: Gfo/Idh/MocA family oxidoreductase [Saprospiraceae bacterium]|nr:Gfo/Idh/MocA family oxidoreductase [Saprospiraceae bacterium]
MQTVSWGILSTAKIGRTKVIPAMQKGQFTTIDAICSRSLASAQKTAQSLGIPKAYGSYEDLLADPDIQAIYIPVPNHLHVEWTLKCLEAGKHVLCEKPIGLNAAEAMALLEETQKYPELKVMEAFMYRHHPQWVKAKEWVDSGAIGRLVTINSTFSYFNADPNNVRNKSDIGGGGLLDIGCYCISLSRFIVGAEPNRVIGMVELDPTMGMDRLASGMMDFGAITASFTCSTQMAPHQVVHIYGTEGRVEIEIPFNAPPDKACRIWLHKGGKTEECLLPVADQYTLQGDLFSQAILDDKPVPTPLSDAVGNMKVIDALFASAQTESWVKL